MIDGLRSVLHTYLLSLSAHSKYVRVLDVDFCANIYKLLRLIQLNWFVLLGVRYCTAVYRDF